VWREHLTNRIDAEMPGLIAVNWTGRMIESAPRLNVKLQGARRLAGFLSVQGWRG
jgi:hypothetical protein